MQKFLKSKIKFTNKFIKKIESSKNLKQKAEKAKWQNAKIYK